MEPTCHRQAMKTLRQPYVASDHPQMPTGRVTVSLDALTVPIRCLAVCFTLLLPRYNVLLCTQKIFVLLPSFYFK